MKIALDATYSIGNQLSGVGIYCREILEGLAGAHPESRFLFCYRPHRYFRSWRESLDANVRRRVLTDRSVFAGLSGVGSCELFHGLNQRLPRIPLARAVATFHDLFVLSGEYSTPEFRARFAAQARDAAARADAIIAVSAFTKSQVISLLGVEPSKIFVVHHGVRRLALEPVAREPIILHVGAIQKRKNLARLVAAFASVAAPWKLVLAGSLGYGAEETEAAVSASRARDRILVTGYATLAELAGWYSRASVFAFPSLDEGFGMPVLEAMAAGIPVVASNASAIPEVAGDAAVLVDPKCTESLADALIQVIENEELSRQLVSRGRERANLFRWETAVHQTWEVYRTLQS